MAKRKLEKAEKIQRMIDDYHYQRLESDELEIDKSDVELRIPEPMFDRDNLEYLTVLDAVDESDYVAKLERDELEAELAAARLKEQMEEEQEEWEND